MALASIGTVIFGTFAFILFWVLATFPSFPGLPVGRTAGAILGAALMVIFQVTSPDAAYAAVDLPILGLLFGTMVVSVYLERADMFKYLAHALSWKCRGGKDLLCRLCFLVAFSSAIFTNDTCCVFFTEFILKLCKEKHLPPEPFLLALASSANLGSSATPIGNPQNLVIAIRSKISFGSFLMGILPAMLAGVTVNTGFLLVMYWKQLSKFELQSELGTKEIGEVVIDQVRKESLGIANAREAKLNLDELTDIDLESYRSKGMVEDKLGQAYELEHRGDTKDVSVTEKQSGGINNPYGFAIQDAKNQGAYSDHKHRNKAAAEELLGTIHQDHPVSLVSRSERELSYSIRSPNSPPLCEFSPDRFGEGRDLISSIEKRRKAVKKWCVYLVTAGMLGALLAGLNLSWSALTAAITLVVLDFTDAGPNLSQVSYSLLVFFSGMFLTVDGFNKTGVPGALWSAVEPHARINHASGVAVLTCVIVLLSNIASNVPTVLLLGPRVAASATMLAGVSVQRSWLILAWASTIAGNLTLVGSAANLIVCEKARMAPTLGYHLSFWRHLRFGFLATLLIVAIGLPMIRG